jgi:hypothetical protein
MKEMSKADWQVVYVMKPVAFDGEVLDIYFAQETDAQAFRDGGVKSPSELLRRAVIEVLGVKIKYRFATAAAPSIITQAIPTVAEAKVEPVNQDRNKLIDPEKQVGGSVLRDVLGAEPIEGDN